MIKKSFKIYSDKTGSLIPFYDSYHFKKFKIKGFFLCMGKKYFRADHAHKICNQILIPIKGKINVEITNLQKKTKKFSLSLKNKQILFIPKKNWVKLSFQQTDSIVLILCDYKYIKSEYIQKKSEFFKLS